MEAPVRAWNKHKGNPLGAETNNVVFVTYEAFCNVEIFIKK